MNKILFLLFLLVNTCYAQSGRWTWLTGDSIPNYAGTFGVQGVPAPGNVPPSVYEACEFKDHQGNFWFYGGLDLNGGLNVRNDLWKFNPSTNEWTWMKGTHSINDPGTFGVQGVPSVTNNPPSLGYGAIGWVDNADNLWLYGGGSNTGYGDLWKYDTHTNEWTWMKGPGTTGGNAVYGTQGVPNISNIPGPRVEVSTSWVDGNDLWFFGGWTSDLNNDLWRYNTSSNMWTWMKGANTTGNPGHWGSIGIEDPNNVPSARYVYSHWTDSIGNFWIYGGSGTDANGTTNGYLGDLWRYNKITNSWTWMNGSNLTSTPATYEARCTVPHNSNPGSRIENRAVWTDSNNDFWMFGGVSSNSVTVGLSDLWKYCVAANKWIFISGDSLPNTSGLYGTAGVSTQNTRPGERCGAIGWINNNNIYLFGGINGIASNVFNDLWRFEIDTTCTPCSQIAIQPVSLFNVSNTTFCEGSCISLTNQSHHATSYHWFFPGAIPSTDTTANPQNICYYSQGVYDVTLVVSNSIGTDTFSLISAITVFPPVAFSPITHHGDTLFSLTGFPSYQWYYYSSPITGSTNYFYVATQNGDYSVQVVDSNGCQALATLINVIAATNDLDNQFTDFSVTVSGKSVFVKMNSGVEVNSELFISDLTGKEILKRKIQLNKGENQIELNDINVAAGYYFLKIRMGEKVLTDKFYIGAK